jgi:hypothetical protein
MVSDFTLAASPNAIQVASGQSGTITLTVTPQFSFAQTVSFACASPPAGVSCTFSPTTVTPSGSAAVTTTMTVHYNRVVALNNAAPNPRKGNSPWGAGSGVFLALCGIGWVARRRRQLLCLLLLAGLAMGMVACGGGFELGSTTSPISVVATSGTLQHNVTVNLTMVH